MRVLRKLHLRENIVLLTIAGVVSAAIIIVAAAAFNAHYSNVASISDAQNLNSTFWGWRWNCLCHYFELPSSGISSSVVGRWLVKL